MNRIIWFNKLNSIVEPVIDGFVNKTIKETFPIHFSPLYKENKEVNKELIFIELYSRTLLSISILFQNENFIKEYNYDNLYKKTIITIKNNFNGYLNFYHKSGQLLVEMSFICLSFIRSPYLWNLLDLTLKKVILEIVNETSKYEPHNNNWILFSCILDIFLYKNKKILKLDRCYNYINKFESFYIGDGWYKDGLIFHMDYYNSFIILPFLLDIYHELSDIDKRFLKNYNNTVIKIQRHCEFLERLISPEGTFPLFGRSITYKTAIFHALVYSSYLSILPNSISYGQVRNALTVVIERMFNNCVDKNNYLLFGFNSFQPEITDEYTNSGSIYFCLLIFIPLGLSNEHLFWKNELKDWTQKKIWNKVSINKDTSLDLIK